MKSIIVGIHSIVEAILNSGRQNKELYCTDDAVKELRKRIPGLKSLMPLNVLKSHDLQELAKKEYSKYDFKFNRIPGGAFLICDPLPTVNMSSLYDRLKDVEKLKIVCLDQVSDVHNVAAILRTASFYDCDYLVISRKGDLNFPPSFFRIASGASEHIPIINVSSLSKFLNKLKDLGICTLGFSEHSEEESISEQNKMCLVLGNEEFGLSNAVSRVLDKTVVLRPKGKTQSLNVSVATAVAMDRFF